MAAGSHGDTLASVTQRMAPRLLHLGPAWVPSLLVLGATALGACSPPPPSALIALLDCSASFQPLRAQAVEWLKRAQRELEPRQDSVTVFRLAEDVHWLYGSERQGVRTFAGALEGYLDATPGATGTALGEGLIRGVEEARAAADRKLVAHVVVLSDGEAERGASGANLDESAVRLAYRQFPPQGQLHLLYLHPKAADRLRRLLLPLLGKRLHLHTEEACRQGLGFRDFQESLKRRPQ